jgi:hypothetical protein
MRHDGGDKTMAQVLNCVCSHGLEAVLVAVELVIESGVLSSEHVLNVLARLNATPIPEFGGVKVDKKLVSQLSTLDFTDTAQNAVLIGGPGTGKTHLATAIGAAGIAAKGKRVRFYSTVDLVNELEKEKREGKAGRIALALLRMDLVIVDELGYLPFSQAGGALLVSSALQAVRAHQRGDHHQPEFLAMVGRVY